MTWAFILKEYSVTQEDISCFFSTKNVDFKLYLYADMRSGVKM